MKGCSPAERAGVVGRIDELRRELDQLIQDSIGANADDEHDPEGATIAFERAQLSSLLEAAERRLSRDRPQRSRASTRGRTGGASGAGNRSRLSD